MRRAAITLLFLLCFWGAAVWVALRVGEAGVLAWGLVLGAIEGVVGGAAGAVAAGQGVTRSNTHRRALVAGGVAGMLVAIPLDLILCALAYRHEMIVLLWMLVPPALVAAALAGFLMGLAVFGSGPQRR